VVEVGVSLWSIQATAAAPALWPSLYARLQADALAAERLGFDSLWVAEHRFWYDGWCPQPVVAAAAALGATTRLRVGTAMHLLPQHDARRVGDAARTLELLSGHRFDLGVGLGYRDEEYDGLGLARRDRGRRMDAALDCLLTAGTAGPPVWVGGMAEAAVSRAARRGLSLLLPPSLHAAEVAAVVDRARQEALGAGRELGRVGIVKDTWTLTGDSRAQERERAWFERGIDAHYREYAGAWWLLRGTPGFEQPELLDRQMRRSVDACVVGTADEVTAELAGLVAAGVDLLVLGVSSDVTRPRYPDVMTQLADEVVPALRKAMG